VKPFSLNDDGGDLVETSYLAQGLLCARQYFKDGNKAEQKLAQRIDELWRGIEFDWHRQDNQNVLYWHWSPLHRWEMNFPVEGYNECLILYVLAAGSPMHGIAANVYHDGWARKGGIRKDSTHLQYGYHLSLKHNFAHNMADRCFGRIIHFWGLTPECWKIDMLTIGKKTGVTPSLTVNTVWRTRKDIQDMVKTAGG